MKRVLISGLFALAIVFAGSDAIAQSESKTVPIPVDKFMDQLQSLTAMHIEELDKAYDRLTWILGICATILTLGGGVGAVSLFRYARQQAQAKVDNVIEDEIRKHVSAATKSVTQHFDGLFADYTARLEDLEPESDVMRDDLEAVRTTVAELRERLEGAEAEPSVSPTEAEPAGVGIDRDDLWQRMKYALLNHKFVWRSMERLALSAGITPQLAEAILREHHDEVRISRGKSGRRIARHLSRQPR